jgi:tape measure domain-containing protein
VADLKLALVISAIDRASAPLRGIAAAVTGIGHVVGGATKGFATFGLAVQGLQTAARMVTAPLAGIVDTAAEFEKLGMRLEALEGSAAGAAKAMDWIRDFAVKTPLEVRDVTQAYAALKNVGIDPTKGALQALTDANAKAGGSAAQLGGVILAVSQMWGKGRIATEEMNQLGERSIPVWGALAKALGKPEAAVRKMVETGKLGRKEIKRLVEELGRQSAGASERFAGSWEGILSNLAEHWTNFKLKISQSGVFDTLKQILQDLLATLDRFAKDGTIGRIAALIGETLTSAIKAGRAAFEALIEKAGGVEPLAQKLIAALSSIAPTASSIAGAVGSLADNFEGLARAIQPAIDASNAFWRLHDQTIGAVTRGAAAATGWVGRQLGIGGGGEGQPAPSPPAVGGGGEFKLGGGAGLDRLAAPTLQRPALVQSQVGGEIVVRLENAPRGARVEKVKPSGGIELGVELGLAMGG